MDEGHPPRRGKRGKGKRGKQENEKGRLTNGQKGEEKEHVDTDDHASRAGGGHLGQIQGCSNRKPTSSQTADQTGSQNEAVDARREDLHQEATRPGEHEELPATQAAEHVCHLQADQGAKRGSENPERRDIGGAVGETGLVVRPIRRHQVEVVDERLQSNGGAESALIVAWHLVSDAWWEETGEPDLSGCLPWL